MKWSHRCDCLRRRLAREMARCAICSAVLLVNSDYYRRLGEILIQLARPWKHFESICLLPSSYDILGRVNTTRSEACLETP